MTSGDLESSLRLAGQALPVTVDICQFLVTQAESEYLGKANVTTIMIGMRSSNTYYSKLGGHDAFSLKTNLKLKVLLFPRGRP